MAYAISTKISCSKIPTVTGDLIYDVNPLSTSTLMIYELQSLWCDCMDVQDSVSLSWLPMLQEPSSYDVTSGSKFKTPCIKIDKH